MDWDSHTKMDLIVNFMLDIDSMVNITTSFENFDWLREVLGLFY